jgi:hypothetical protein
MQGIRQSHQHDWHEDRTPFMGSDDLDLTQSHEAVEK